MTPADSELLTEAVELLREAGALTLRWFRSAELAVDAKSDGTPVTAADRAAERFLREAIAQRYPDDTIIGEEEVERVGTSGRTWIIDPIDGTKAFTHGVPLYSNLLAIDDAEGPAIGVINLPALGETVYAGRGLGCFCNDAPARVSAVDDLERAYASTSGLSNWPDPLVLAVNHAVGGLRTWGDGYGYALVATGRIEAMIDPEVALWDVAPLPVILTEAGGRFSALDGSDGRLAGSGLATNGLLHDAFLGLAAGTRPPS